MKFFEALDAVVRKLRDLGVSALRRALRTYTSFVRWLREFKRRIADELDKDGLLKDLYCAVCETFDLCPPGACA